MDVLVALDDFLTDGIFEPGVVGLEQIYWRSRTVQEFFAAFWLARYCTPQDVARMRGWLYLPERPQTEEYYWVWRFLCEMHADARDPEAWTLAVEPIYQPGNGQVAGTTRSTEMMYRAWASLDRLAQNRTPSAYQVRERFLGEFENQILSGRRGRKAKLTAQQLCRSFIQLPKGRFKMGAPKRKQQMPEDEKRAWSVYLRKSGDPELRAEDHISNRTYGTTKQWQQIRAQTIIAWASVFSSQNTNAVARMYYLENETPMERVQYVEALLLSQWPTINAWYRLFRPGHGEVAPYFRKRYSQISPRPDTPATFVTWYDAWAFCMWAHWDGRSCRLPYEFEWEYAAKAGTRWDANYWWGDTMNSEKCCTGGVGDPLTWPVSSHANPWGLVDMLGNVWEWCIDEYREKYDRFLPSDRSDRMLRGGSWRYIAGVARAAFRSDAHAESSSFDVGFRIARSLQ